MSTGYTASVSDGTVTELPEFAMQCARAFGALVMMRDMPLSAPVPDRFEASTSYHDGVLAAARKRLDELDALSADEIAAAATIAQAERERSHESYLADKRIRKGRYEAMIEKVRDWTQPTPDHEPLRDFMIEQVNQSIDFDCSVGPWSNKPETLTPAAWLGAEVEKAQRDIAYHEKARAEEIERTESRNKWLADLRASLKTEAA